MSGCRRPPGWRVAKLGELGRYHNGRAFKKSEWATSGRPIIRIQDLTGTGTNPNYYKGEAEARHEVAPGDLLVSWAATLGAFIWKGPHAVLNQHIFKVESNQDRQFHFYCIQNVLADLYRRSHGTGMVHVTRRVFDETVVLLPPLADQRAIVAAIESYFSRLDAASATLERVQRNLERYRASVLKAAVEGRLVPTEAELAKKEGRSYEPASVLLKRILAERRRRWEEAELTKLKAKGKPPTDDRWKAKYEEPAAPDTTDLPELPEGWCWASMDQLGIISGGLTKNAQREKLAKQRPYLRVANVYADELRLDEIKRIGVTEDEAERAELLADDLLVVEGNGSVDQIGRVALWNGSVPGCVHQNHIIKVRFVGATLPKWSLTWMLSTSGRGHIERAASSTSGLHTLSLSKIASLPVPVPPEAEQLSVRSEVDRLLSSMASLRSCVEQGNRRTQSLRQSILKWAFEGCLIESVAAVRS